MPPEHPIVVPYLGCESIAFGLWLVENGERVSENDRIAELLIPGACVDLAAPASGTVFHRAGTGDRLRTGERVGVIQ
ncbi:MAG: lipoyl domain-containing protein [Gemmataceae bacterium]